MSEGTHQAAWLRIVVVYIRKTQFSRDEAHFSVSYEINDRKHVFEIIIIRFSGSSLYKHLGAQYTTCLRNYGEQIICPFFNLLFFI